MMLGKAVLGISALAFIGYGFLSLLSPGIPASFAGIQLSNGDAYAEVGAMYGGLLVEAWQEPVVNTIVKKRYRFGS